VEVLRVENLKKSFAGKEVLKGVSFSLKAGELLAVLGPNASGKTTLIKCVLGLVLPDEGRVTLMGKPAEGKAYRKLIGYMPQTPPFPENLTPEELLLLVSRLREQEPNAEELVRLFKLEPFMRQKIKTLSGGTRQKVNALLAFAFDAPLFILDEPTVSLDPLSSARLKRLVLKEKEEGKAFLITSHVVPEVEHLADRVVFLVEGKVVLDETVEGVKRKTGKTSLEEALLSLLEERA